MTKRSQQETLSRRSEHTVTSSSFHCFLVFHQGQLIITTANWYLLVQFCWLCYDVNIKAMFYFVFGTPFFHLEYTSFLCFFPFPPDQIFPDEGHNIISVKSQHYFLSSVLNFFNRCFEEGYKEDDQLQVSSFGKVVLWRVRWSNCCHEPTMRGCVSLNICCLIKMIINKTLQTYNM